MKPGFQLEENDERLALMALKIEKLSEQVDNIDHRLKQTEEEVKYWLSYQCFIFRNSRFYCMSHFILETASPLTCNKGSNKCKLESMV